MSPPKKSARLEADGMDIEVKDGGNKSDSSIPRMLRFDEVETEVVEKQAEEGPVTFGVIRNLLKEELSTVKIP